jgi:tetratricopeptide (TPR) repeat protein
MRARIYRVRVLVRHLKLDIERKELARAQVERRHSNRPALRYDDGVPQDRVDDEFALAQVATARAEQDFPAGEDFVVNDAETFHRIRVLSLHALLMAAFLVSVPLAALGATGASPTWEQAGAVYQKGDWKAAAEAYGAITKREPGNGRAWYRLGVSYAKLGRPKEALPAYLKAETIGQNPTVRYSLACAYANLADTTQAYAWLEKAIAGGFRSPETMKSDSDLEALRSSSHFQSLLERAEWNKQPCAHAAENRQFDFWLGEWEVRSPEGAMAGRNSITRENGDCWIHEHWAGAMAGTGESVNFYNATTKKWHQTWVDDQGAIAEFDGDFRDGAMRLEGYRQGPNNDQIPARLTLTPLPDGRVRQLGENSTDGGKTWTVLYDLFYTRKDGGAGGSGAQPEKG